MRFRRRPTADSPPGGISCRELVRLVTDYLEGTLPAEDRRRFELHIARCDGCSTYLAQIRETVLMSGALTEQSIDPDAREELLAAFRSWHGR